MDCRYSSGVKIRMQPNTGHPWANGHRILPYTYYMLDIDRIYAAYSLTKQGFSGATQHYEFDIEAFCEIKDKLIKEPDHLRAARLYICRALGIRCLFKTPEIAWEYDPWTNDVIHTFEVQPDETNDTWDCAILKDASSRLGTPSSNCERGTFTIDEQDRLFIEFTLDNRNKIDPGDPTLQSLKDPVERIKWCAKRRTIRNVGIVGVFLVRHATTIDLVLPDDDRARRLLVHFCKGIGATQKEPPILCDVVYCSEDGPWWLAQRDFATGMHVRSFQLPRLPLSAMNRLNDPDVCTVAAAWNEAWRIIGLEQLRTRLQREVVERSREEDLKDQGYAG